MFKSLLLASLILTTSCALFPEQREDNFYAYYTGKDMPANVDSEAIRAELEQVEPMSGGEYSVRAFPVSKTWLDARANEVAAVNNLDQSSLERAKQLMQEEFLQDKSCVHVEIKASRHTEVSQLESWFVEVLDEKGQRWPLTWKEEYLNKPIAQSSRRIQRMTMPVWLMDGIACSANELPLEKGFKVRVTPKRVSWPFDKSVTLHYDFKKVQYVDGKAVVTPKKSSHYKAYRGW